MKIRNKYISLFFLFALISFAISCSKDDGAITKRITIEKVPTITTNIEAGSLTTITFTNQAAFSGKFKVALFFAGAESPTKIDVVVRKNGLATSVKVFKADVTSLPVTYTITAAEIATLFGTPLALNDNYDFAPDIYVGDKKYQAFPVTGTGSNSGVTGMPGFGEFVRYQVR